LLGVRCAETADAQQLPPGTTFTLTCVVQQDGSLSCTAPAPGPTATSTPSPTPTIRATPTVTTAPSPTPTATSAPTATATPPPTPTPTPGTASNSIAQILADSDETTPHDGPLSPCVPDSYSWARTSDRQRQTPGTSFDRGTGWGVLNWACGQNVAGVTVTVRNFQAYVLAFGSWVQVTSRVTWCASMNPATNLFGGPGCGGLGPDFPMPNGAYSLHWASDHNLVFDTGACALTMFEARYAGPAGAFIMADAGFDWWSGTSNAGAVVGRYHRLTGDWQWIDATTCSAAQLAAHPPPGVTN